MFRCYVINMAVISISLPESLLDKVEQKVEEHGYSGRSDLTREALRSFVEGFGSEPKLSGEVLATVTVVLSKDAVEKEVASLRHDYRDRILDRTHTCIEGDRCTEVLVIESDVSELNEIVGRVRSTDGVVSTDYTAKPVGEVTE